MQSQIGGGGPSLGAIAEIEGEHPQYRAKIIADISHYIRHRGHSADPGGVECAAMLEYRGKHHIGIFYSSHCKRAFDFTMQR